jgi:hypothetical protein
MGSWATTRLLAGPRAGLRTRKEKGRLGWAGSRVSWVLAHNK